MEIWILVRGINDRSSAKMYKGDFPLSLIPFISVSGHYEKFNFCQAACLLLQEKLSVPLRVSQNQKLSQASTHFSSNQLQSEKTEKVNRAVKNAGNE